MKVLLYSLLLIVNSGYTHKCVHNKLFGNKTLGIATGVEDKTYNMKLINVIIQLKHMLLE